MVTGTRVYVRSRSGKYLALGPGGQREAEYGPAIVQDVADNNAVWLMRWPFNDRGGTKGPILDMKKWPSSATNSTNFNLVHEKTAMGLSWYNRKHKQLVGGRYYGNYGYGNEDASDRDSFVCRRDVLENDQYGYSYFALNNSDRSLVADLNAGTVNVGAWEWDGSHKQFWQFIAVGGGPI